MIYKSILGSAILALGLSGAALAANSASDQSEMNAFSQAKVGASDAVKSVESKSRGKVVELTLMGQAGKPAYQISVMQADGTETTFLVDAITGAVSETTDVQDMAQAAGENDAAEAGESANDDDSANEDAD